jgi:type III pantothenate kinase
LVIVIDSGNTFTKIGQFDNGKLNKIYNNESIAEVLQTIRKLNPTKIVAGSVNFSIDRIKEHIADIPIYSIDNVTPVPFNLNYKTPDTLGIDRKAVITYAWDIKPKENILVIDAGTCITYDFISKDGVYMGGGISPGLEMRFRSLHEYTANLPEVSFQEKAFLIGDSTRNSILSGVINGTIAEIKGIIKRYEKKFDNLTIFMSGGSAIFFESKIKRSIFAIPNMGLLGLFCIYEYNNRSRKV